MNDHCGLQGLAEVMGLIFSERSFTQNQCTALSGLLAPDPIFSNHQISQPAGKCEGHQINSVNRNSLYQH